MRNPHTRKAVKARLSTGSQTVSGNMRHERAFKMLGVGSQAPQRGAAVSGTGKPGGE